MNCKKCNAELTEDAIYCPSCGVRVDGKKRCKNCGRDVPEEGLYCIYCGTRLDGKIICAKCGEAFEGKFCPKCGVPAVPVNTVAAGNRAVKADRGQPKASKVITTVKQSVLYGALCVLFICSFFVTFSMKVNVQGISLRTGLNSTSFYFFIDIFSEVKDALADFGTLGVDYFMEAEVALYLTAAFTAACAAAIIIICTIYFILGTVVFVKAAIHRQEVSMSKYVITPAIVTLALMCFLKGFIFFVAEADGSSAIIVLGAVPIVNIVLVSVALAAAAVLHIITHLKTARNNILNYVINAAGVLLALLVIVTLSTSVLKARKTVSDLDLEALGAGMPAFMISMLFAMGFTPKGDKLSFFKEIIPNTIVAFVMYTVVFVVAVVAMLAFIKGIINRNSVSRAISCVFAGISTVFSIVYLVMLAVICKENLAGAFSLGASSICALVFSVLMLATSIVVCALLSKPPLEQESTAQAAAVQINEECES